MSTMRIEYILDDFECKRGIVCVIPNVRDTRQNKYRNINKSKLKKQKKLLSTFFADLFDKNYYS